MSRMRSSKSKRINGINLCHFFKNIYIIVFGFFLSSFILFILIFLKQNWTYN